MTSAKEFKRPTLLKRRLIRLRQNIPSGGIMAVDKLIGRAAGLNSIPYFLPGEVSSPSYFILGSGRSGNTLLRRLLMESFDTFIPPEMPGLGKCTRRLVQLRYRKWETYCRTFFSSFETSANISVRNSENGIIYNLWAELKLDTRDLIRQSMDIPPQDRSGAALIHLLYQNILSNADFQVTPRTIIGDKTPWNVMYTHQIEAFFPHARFVYIVRHPLAVAYSYVQSLSAVTGNSFEDAARRWARAQTNCLDLARRVGTERLRITQYETLVTSREESHRIGAFLQLPEWEGERVTGPISSADAKLVQHKRINQRVDTSSVDTWRSEITGDMKKRLLKIVEPAMKRLDRELGIDYSENH